MFVFLISDASCHPLRFENTTSKFIPVHGDCNKKVDCLTGYITLAEFGHVLAGIQGQPYERSYQTQCLLDGTWSRIDDCIRKAVCPLIYLFKIRFWGGGGDFADKNFPLKNSFCQLRGRRFILIGALQVYVLCIMLATP